MSIPNDYKIVKIFIPESITLQYCVEKSIHSAFEFFSSLNIILNAGDACYCYRPDNNVPKVSWVQLPSWQVASQFVWNGTLDDLKRIAGEHEKVIIVITQNMTDPLPEILKFAEENGHFVFSFSEKYTNLNKL